MNDPQEAGTQQEQQQQQIRIGFEAVLDKFVPNWKTESEDPLVRNAIEFSRAIYLQGLTDASVFINSALVSLSEGHNWLLHSAQNVALVVQPAAADEQQASSAAFFANAQAATADVAPTQPVASVLASAPSSTDNVPHSALRGETSSMQHMDTLGYAPVHGKGGEHDGAGASGDWERTAPSETQPTRSVSESVATTTAYSSDSHTTSGGDSGGSSCGDSGGGSCGSD